MIPPTNPTAPRSAYQPFLVAGPRTGLERDVVPYLLPNDAYPTLINAYLWRARVQKKGGTTLLGRLGFRTIYEATGAGVNLGFNYTLPPFEPGTATLTDGVTVFQDNGAGVFAVIMGTGINGIVNYATFHITGTFTPAANAALILASYQAVTDNNSPAMGLCSIDQEDVELVDGLIGFDLINAYQFDDIANRFRQLWNYAGTLNPVAWTGSNSSFFSYCNWAGAFWATNFVYGYQPIVNQTTAFSGDGIRWYAPTTTAGGNPANGWINFMPPLDAVPNYLLGARFILPYKDRLIVFNTWEGPNYAGAIHYPQRVRWSVNGSPFYVDPTPTPPPAGFAFNAAAWLTPPEQYGQGGFFDLSTSQPITGVEYIKDDLIIYCERSKYRLVWTGNADDPFYAQAIDIEFGCQSPFSLIPFDSEVYSVAYNGITTTDGVQAARIDEKVPDQSFGFQNATNGNLRVHGIRDYYAQLVYWTYVDSEGTAVFPNRSLVYNYLDKNWAIFNTQYTCFGYYQRINSLLWGTANNFWSTYNIQWASPSSQSDFPLVVGGNQHGYVLYLENQLTSSSTGNDTSLSITGISAANPAVITIPNHGLELEQWIQITGVEGVTNINSTIQGYKVYNIIDANNITLQTYNALVLPPVNPYALYAAIGTYTFGGRVTIIDNFQIQTKRFPFFMEQGLQTRLGYTDFLLDAQSIPADFSIDFYDNENFDVPVTTEIISAMPNTFPFPQRVWVRSYFNCEGQFFALGMYLSDAQQSDISNANQQQVIHAMMLWAKPTARWVT